MSFLKLSFVFVFFLGLSCSKKSDEEIKPNLGTVTESVYASGIIKADGQYTVFSTVNGTLQKVNVTVGQSINKGQSLFELESDKAAIEY